MANTIEAVEHERVGEDGLGGVLEPFWQAVHELYYGRGVHRDAYHGRGQVADGEGVERDGETNTGHTVPDGGDPRQLRLVDGEVRAGRPLDPLRVGDACFGRGGEGLDLDAPSQHRRCTEGERRQPRTRDARGRDLHPRRARSAPQPHTHAHDSRREHPWLLAT